MTASQHWANLGSTTDRELTLGLVQKQLHKGLSGAELVQSFGSPNIVTKDENGMETWVYDKIATESSYSNSNQGVGLAADIQTGIDRTAARVSTPNGSVSFGSGASNATQRTLTIVIKFNGQERVESYSYHSTKF